MSTSISARAGLQTPASGDRTWDVPIAATIAALEGIQAIGSLAVTATEYPSTSLNVKVAAGVFMSSAGALVTYAGTSSFALSPTATNSLWLTDAGVLTVGTTGFPGPGTKRVPLAVVVAGASTLTLPIVDARVPFVSAG